MILVNKWYDYNIENYTFNSVDFNTTAIVIWL